MDKRTHMTPLHNQGTTDQGERGEEDLLSLLQEGQDSAGRVSLHACLLRRRLQLGADRAALLQIVQAIQFAIEDLQALFKAAVQAATPAPSPTLTATEGTEVPKPLQAEIINLRAFLTRCVESVRQRAQRRGVFLLCDISPDLPPLTTDPEKLAQVFSLLLEHAVGAGGKEGLEVRVRWAEGALVVDIYDAGRGISTETYVSLHHLVGSLQGTLIVTRELGTRSRVELSLPPVPAQGNETPSIAPANTKENGR